MIKVETITESTYKYTTYILCTKYRILFFPQITTLSWTTTNLCSFVDICPGHLSGTAKMVSRLRGTFVGTHLEPDHILSFLELLLCEFALVCCRFFGS